jgi:hypothetical protein
MTTRKAAAPSEGPRKAEPQDASANPSNPAGAWPPWLKWVASALIALHLTAVFVAPLAFASRGSPAMDSAFAVFHPYIDALYLNHGYSFFAPEVGPSHLVRYKVEFADGREPVVGTFPNLATEQPRLLYHRHFMLAEALANRFVPPLPPAEPALPANPSQDERIRHKLQQEYYVRDLAQWRHASRQYEAMRQSFAEHLKHEYGGSQVTLTRVEHRLAVPDEIRHLKHPLNAPDSYIDLPETALPEPRS